MTTAEAPVASPSQHSRVDVRAGFGLALINLAWAASAINAKIALGPLHGPTAGHIGPLTLAFARFAPAALLLALWLWLRRGLPRFERADWRTVALTGCVGMGVTYAIFYGGMNWTTATDCVLIVASEPILMAFMAWALLGERIRRAQGVGLFLGFGGVYLIVCDGFLPKGSSAELGNAAIVLALCFESYASVAGKRLTRRYGGLPVLAAQMALASLVLLPLTVFEITGRGGLTMPAPAPLAAIAYLVVVCTLIGYGVWYALLPRLRISAMAAFLFIQPVMGPIYSAILLHEHLDRWTAIGGGLVLTGVWLVARNGGE